MTGRSPIEWLFYSVRNFRLRKLFRALNQYCKGDVLDVGGWDFFLRARDRHIPFTTWTTLESSNERLPNVDDAKFRCIAGDGCAMPFGNNTFDTVLNIQVLEHVFEPIKMVQEIARVLKSDGHAVFVIPQTAVMHMAPEHYYNFTRFWIEKAMKQSHLEIIEITPLGGFWSTIASRCVHFFLHSTRCRGYSSKECHRNMFFYILFPFMVFSALFIIPLCLLLSFGDLSEEPNNHLVLVRKI